jgi:hypothetical protein
MIDLSDVTFLIPTRIYSEEQEQNLQTLTTLLTLDYKANIIVLEADYQPKFTPSSEKIDYYFIYDFDIVFHKPMYVNRLLQLAKTPYVAVWNDSAICIPEQIVETVNILRINSSTLAYPYNGKIHYTNKDLSNSFHQDLSYDTLVNSSFKMPSKGYYYPGEAYFLNKSKYLSLGGENIIFYGTNLDDEARLKRVELLENEVYFASSPLFHLWHPKIEEPRIKENEEFANIKELIKICQTDIKNLMSIKI